MNDTPIKASKYYDQVKTIAQKVYSDIDGVVYSDLYMSWLLDHYLEKHSDVSFVEFLKSHIIYGGDENGNHNEFFDFDWSD